MSKAGGHTGYLEARLRRIRVGNFRAGHVDDGAGATPPRPPIVCRAGLRARAVGMLGVVVNQFIAEARTG